MSVLVLNAVDVERLLPMRECIDLMAEALGGLARGQAYQPLRSVVRPPGSSGLLGLMPAWRGGSEPAFGLKAICIFEDNPSRGLDAHQGGVLLFDGETGELRALVNGSAITAVRTAAVSGLATRLLAREDVRELAVLGAGVQARAHLRAMAEVRPFGRARLWSRRPQAAYEVVHETSVPFPVSVVESAEEAVSGADVVCTTTSAREPVLRREWLAAGAHVNAVGSSVPSTRELDTATVAASSFFVDSRGSALAEAGDFLMPVREGVVGPDHIRAELGEVIVGARDGRTSARELTVFKSLGLGVEDLAAARYVVARALESGAGARVPF